MTRPTLLLLDCQQPVCTGRSGREAERPEPGVVDRITRLLVGARHNGWRVIHSQFESQPGLTPASLSPARPIAGLEPLARETVFVRTALSAYSDPAFARVVGTCSSGPVFLVGFSAPFSVLATAFDAVATGHRFTVIPEAIGTPALGEQSASQVGSMALEMLNRLARVSSYEKVQAEWLGGPEADDYRMLGTG